MAKNNKSKEPVKSIELIANLIKIRYSHFENPLFKYVIISLYKQIGHHTLRATSYHDDSTKNKGVFDWSKNLNASKYKGDLKFKALSAFIHNLDLVISVDTSILHLAASLGKETWGVISIDPDWRWGKFHEFYKYKNLKIYKQNKFNDWQETIKIIKKDLAEKLQT